MPSPCQHDHAEVSKLCGHSLGGRKPHPARPVPDREWRTVLWTKVLSSDAALWMVTATRLTAPGLQMTEAQHLLKNPIRLRHLKMDIPNC